MNADQTSVSSLYVAVLLAFGLCNCGNAVVPPAIPSEAIEHEIIARYPLENWNCIAILVAPGISDTDLTALATELRRSYPENVFQVFDDTSQIESFVEWRTNAAQEDFVKPDEWIGDHHVATIRRFKNTAGKWEWQLRGGPAHPAMAGRRISTLGT